MTFTTPISSAGRNTQGGEALPLKTLQVGLSISNSPDLADMGLGPSHLQDAMLELVWAYDSQKREDELIVSPELRGASTGGCRRAEQRAE